MSGWAKGHRKDIKMNKKAYCYTAFINLDGSEKSQCCKIYGFNKHNIAGALQDFLTDMETKGLIGNDVLSITVQFQRWDSYSFLERYESFSDLERAF